jgi:hypothetical protein
MTDADLELRLRDWLASDASVIRTPPRLRARVFDLPAMPAPRGSLWSRFSGLALSSALVTAGVTAIVVTTMFFNMFDVPAGADGDPCNNRQIQRALDHLRDAEGYRYVNHDQVRKIDPNAEVSFDDPQYVWTDGWGSEGAYLAPDRVRDVRTFHLPEVFDRGYVEHVQIDGSTYQLQVVDGVETWTELENWPTANLVNGYVANAFPAISIPGVTALEWRSTPVPDDLPGVGGCTAAAAIPFEQPPEGMGVIPSHMIDEKIVAVRVDVSSGRPSTVYLGPSETGFQGDGDIRNIFELTWDTPSADEFVAPVGAVPDPNIGTGGTPPPSPTPIPLDPDAWAPIELDGPGSISDVVTADDRFVAVGSSQVGNTSTGWIWNSSDGITWESVGRPEGFADIGFSSIDWDGEVFLAIGYATDNHPDDPQLNTIRPESWISTDGVTWERGGVIGPETDSSDVANIGRPIAAGPGWVVGGSIWSLTENQQEPAIFTSRDGDVWTAAQLEGTASGSLGSLVELSDGRLFATGCEAPGPTNSGQFGAACYQRPWHSDDGTTWTSGATSDVELGSATRWGDRLVGVGSDADPSGQTERTPRIMTSTDGVSWSAFRGFDSGQASAVAIRVVGDELIVDGQMTDGGPYPYATAWRSADGEDWEQVSLGLPTGGNGSFINAVIDTQDGVVFLGQVQLGETETMPVMWAEP